MQTSSKICLLIVVAALSFGTARAATLVETSVGGESVWLIDDPNNQRILVAGRAGSKLIDLRTGTIYLISPNGTAQKIDITALPDHMGPPPEFDIEKLGPGPRVADYATTRFRISIGGETCSTIDANLSLAEPLTQTIEAFTLLDRLTAAIQGAGRPPCQRIPLKEYARIGWGLRIADDGAPAIETVLVVRDYQPMENEMAIPAASIDVTETILNGGYGETRRDP
jgi:hypothetical protein